MKKPSKGKAVMASSRSTRRSTTEAVPGPSRIEDSQDIIEVDDTPTTVEETVQPSGTLPNPEPEDLDEVERRVQALREEDRRLTLAAEEQALQRDIARKRMTSTGGIAAPLDREGNSHSYG